MADKTLTRTGIVGYIVTAICRALPILVVLLGAVSFSAWAGGPDYVLIRMPIVFVGLTVYALNRRRRVVQCCVPATVPNSGNGKNE
ncbi:MULTISPECIES: mercury resistance system transport protein MerF [Methylococcus]|jgi:mercuric ion transport protein|uniref:mercury resistance system transport protein MerF n=1 Tax=Methylococcus TaxID=413 RepID=UPI001C52FD44|nr:mercury resistance system transport protein MerF [Methylococcus capsulatus]QXP87946.1 mercury resistance system transport protein MerF [Methylococcus capsulatus]QXP92313.1 mercury resistance system transport protein MerF [Methylococcus capsulatus]UQN12970.1 mercury resistance system transport protein MerF [Methylococcus capsulatus]